MAKLKIDIIVPIYYSPALAVRCIKSVLANSNFQEYDLKVIVVSDSGNPDFNKLLNFLLQKEGALSKIEFLEHDTNKGFIEACYTGIGVRESDYKLLLNSDTLVMPGWLEPMVDLAEFADKIALVNPATNNAPEIEIPFPPGHNIHSVHKFFQKLKIPKKAYLDIVTSVGFCLLIKDKWIKKYGFFDREFGAGYGEETDLHFRYTKQGLRALIAPNSFVYHRGEGSFTDRDERLKKSYQMFLERHGDAYHKDYPKFKKHSVLNDIKKQINHENSLDAEVIFLTPQNNISNGGIRIITNICNALNEAGISATCAHVIQAEEKQLVDRLFASIKFEKLLQKDIKPKCIVYSLHDNIREVFELAFYVYYKHGYIPQIVHLSQGIEGWFDGHTMEEFQRDIAFADHTIAISKFLRDFLKSTGLKLNITTIVNSISLDFYAMYCRFKELRKQTSPIRVTASMRIGGERGAYLVEEAFEKLPRALKNKIELTTVGDYRIKNKRMGVKIKQLGFIAVDKMPGVLAQTDIFIEPGLHHGFGLTSLEAAFAGARVLSSDNDGAKSALQSLSDITFFKVGSSEDLAHKLAGLVNDFSHSYQPQLAQVYAHSEFESFPKYVAFFQKVLAAPQKTKVDKHMMFQAVHIPASYIRKLEKLISTHGRVKYRYWMVDNLMQIFDSSRLLYRVLEVFTYSAKGVLRRLKK